MDVNGPKRRRVIKGGAERESSWRKTEALTSAASKFPLLELPYPILCDIFSRLPLLDILRCRCVCKTILGLVKDPYFSKLHLTRAPAFTTNLILQQTMVTWGALHFFTVDIRESTFAPSCSSDNQNAHSYLHHERRRRPRLRRSNADFSFRTQPFCLVGSCNGVLCLYFRSPESFYCICNPLLGEYVSTPPITASNQLFRTKHSAFGYCPVKMQYKVITFIPEQMVAHINTLGSDSWRRIENAPSPKWNSLDPFLNGALHWITSTDKPSELISSFNLEKETFKSIPPPAHFNAHFLKKLDWINIGVLRGCICIFYIYDRLEFVIWVMKEYGVKESWIREFSIDMNYCKLDIDDLRQPLKIFSNGDLWFRCSSDSIVCYSSQKRTFRKLRSVPRPWSEISAHDLSFLSLRDVAGVEKNQVGSLKIVKRV